MRSSFFIVLLFVGVGIVAAQNSDRVAVLTEVTGIVEYSQSGSGSFSQGASFGTALFTNDRLRTADGAKASVLFSNGDLLTVGSNRTIVITSGGFSAAGDESSRIDDEASLSAATLALHRSGEGEIAALSGLRSGGDERVVSVLAPSNSSIRETRPTFIWSASRSFSAYSIRIFNASGVIWQGSSEGNELKYPESAPDLAPGEEYFWQVTGEDLLDEYKSDVVTFSILTEQAQADVALAEQGLDDGTLDPAGSSYRLLKGSIYAKAGLLQDAIVEFKSLIELYPESPLGYELLAGVYAESGLSELAIATVQKARALQD